MIRDLFPFKINSAIVQDGSIHFRAFQGATPVDVYVSQVEGSIDNLSNIRDETNPLVSTVQAKGLVMNQAKFEYQMSFDPFSYRPTFHLAVRVLGLDVTKINDLARTYGKFDFKRGWFDLILETDALAPLHLGKPRDISQFFTLIVDGAARPLDASRVTVREARSGAAGDIRLDVAHPCVLECAVDPGLFHEKGQVRVSIVFTSGNPVAESAWEGSARSQSVTVEVR